MNNLQTKNDGALSQYEPEGIKKRQAQADGLAEYARKIRDWPLLEDAIDAKIEDQREFVRWWDENVGVRHGAGRGNKNNADPRSFSAEDAEAETGISQQQVSKWRKWLKKPQEYKAKLYGSAYAKAMAEKAMSDVRGTTGTGENEWFTPPEHIALARSVMGGIDLDPASNEQANKVVQADKIYSKRENGLVVPWRGRIWLNPPYAQPAISHFADKMVEEVTAGNVEEAVMLTHNYTDTAWFQKLAAVADAICFTRGRVRFVSPSGEVAAPTQGQAFFYFGDRVSVFAESFGDIGFVVGRL
jgi:phage N-6-adenine-methyltransferase